MSSQIEEADNLITKETLDHAKDGFKNAQEVIKFLDTKTAVVTGLSTLLGGFLLVVLKWSVESDANSRPTLPQLTFSHPSVATWFCLFVVISLIAAVVCLCAAVWSVIARAGPKNLEYTVLFPAYERHDAAAACNAFQRKLKGMSRIEIIKEYEDQLNAVGMILGRKLNDIRISCIALVIQLLSLTLALVLLSAMYAMHSPSGRAALSATCCSGIRKHA